ncbi:MAG: diguanylate cyclase (GGDEF)-like protein/PAS domain S-box-containing protein [Marinobacter psychrophilus]|jgi:diguanylate cyclase (GGDEF)-like protein/PAS domain S-box-containing protein
MNHSKSSQLKSSAKIILAGFIMIILLVMLFALLVSRENTKLAELNNKIYHHPFSFSVAVFEINIDILAMHQYMKDVALAKNKNELEVAISLVEKHKNDVYQNFKLIKERFLGNQETINSAYITFVDWKPIRNEVINLKFDKQGQLAAAINRGKSAAYVKVLNQRMNVLKDLARKKAIDFKSDSQNAHDASKSYLYAMLIFTLLSAVMTAIFVILLVRKADDYRNKVEERFYRIVNKSEVSIKKSENELKLANKELTLRNKDRDKREDELVIAEEEKDKLADELVIAEEEKGKRADELVLANEELAFQNAEKDKRADELVLANEELAFQNAEKDKRADELIIANEEKEKRASELALAASVFTHARECIIITDADATIIDVNDTFIHITGFSREEAIGQNARMLQSGRQSRDFYIVMWHALLTDGYWSGELWNRRKNGEMYAEMKTISAVQNKHGITTHYVSLGNDITPMKKHQDQLEWLANYDVLTSLPNRTLLADRLGQAMVQSQRHHNSVAVVFLDLDSFKDINDSHGHDVGDELLIIVSRHMKKALREGDTLARIGGDEFVAVLADLASVEDYEPVLERFLLAASQPITVGEVVIKVSASIGVTLYPQDNVDADLLMRHADQAMYVAKELGKNRYHFFDTVQDNALKVKMENLKTIRSALDNHQFVLYYQPKVNMRTGLVMGIEALIRWQHPERGLLNPIEFLPVIEKNPMIIEMGEWVIDTALTQISQWQAVGIDLPISISVNIAPIQLRQPYFAERLATLLSAHPDVEPRYLELEVLETSALDDFQHVSTIMDACIKLGVNFALDDFGTGYSSLTHLRRLPARLIKVDQSFVRDMLVDADDLAIVEGAIVLVKTFKREVIAEGVETIEHGTALLQLGCELAQGYGIARPMPASDVPAWISDWKPDGGWQA